MSTFFYIVAAVVGWMAFLKRNGQLKVLRNEAEDLRARIDALKQDNSMLGVRHESYEAAMKQIDYLREAMKKDVLVWSSYDERAKCMKEFYPWSR